MILLLRLVVSRFEEKKCMNFRKTHEFMILSDDWMISSHKFEYSTHEFITSTHKFKISLLDSKISADILFFPYIFTNFFKIFLHSHSISVKRFISKVKFLIHIIKFNSSAMKQIRNFS